MRTRPVAIRRRRAPTKMKYNIDQRGMVWYTIGFNVPLDTIDQSCPCLGVFMTVSVRPNRATNLGPRVLKSIFVDIFPASLLIATVQSETTE